MAFHAAALKWFCLHHELGALHPVRLIAGAALFARAVALALIDGARPEHSAAATQLKAGRPEGGVAV